jgi:hypothetical protein
MNIGTAWSTEEQSQEAISQVYASVEYDSHSLIDYLHKVAPDVPLQGSTSCQGVMTAEGFHSVNGRGLGLFGICDPAGSYGVGAARISDSARGAGARAIAQAITAAGRIGEVPDLVWISGVPGYEETVLSGIQDVIGPNVPVAGGSSADNNVRGLWQQFAGASVYTDAVVVGALYPSSDTYYSFHNGYSPTEIRGRVTRAQDRTLQEIDGQPAAEIYNAWTNGSISSRLAGGNVLGDTTLFPLGREVGKLDSIPLYRLAHPDSVTAEGGLTLFTDIHEGEELVLMSGTRSSLVARAGRVAHSALAAGQLAPDAIVGALIIYCAGCMLTVQDEMSGVVAGVNDALGGKPYLGAYTFGEQGCFVNGENHHGNLMISAVVFAKGTDD